MAKSTNRVVVEEGNLFGWEVTGYEDVTEIQYFEWQDGKRVDIGKCIEFGAGEITELIAKALLKVNVKEWNEKAIWKTVW